MSVGITRRIRPWRGMAQRSCMLEFLGGKRIGRARLGDRLLRANYSRRSGGPQRPQGWDHPHSQDGEKRMLWSIFDPALYRNHAARWHFPEENATFNPAKMSTCRSKML